MLRSKSRFILLISLGVVTVLGCAAKTADLVRTRAATDFSCPAEEIELTHLSGKFDVHQYKATGCDQADRYQAKCGQMFFMCKVSSFEEIDRHNAQVEGQMTRQNGCHSDKECVDQYGDDYLCNDYICTKQ